jgi:hypothetical protein
MTEPLASPRQGDATCLNCGEALSGPYCHACGQKSGGPPLHLHDLLHELAHELLHFDSKIWRTLRFLLVAPGTLTREYIEGRRVRYVGPVRLFLVASVAFFGLASFIHVGVDTEVPPEERSQAEAELRKQTASPEGGRFEQAMLRGAQKAVSDPEHLRAAAVKAFSKSSFLLLPIFAFVTWRLFLRQQPSYIGHLYFALHFHAFAFLLLSVATLLALLRIPSQGIVLLGVGSLLLVYFFSALRRAFEPSWLRTMAAGTLALVFCSALNAVLAIGVFVGTIWFL